MIKILFNMIITSKTTETDKEEEKPELKSKKLEKHIEHTKHTEICYYCGQNIKNKYTYGKYKYCSISCVNNDMDLYID